MNDSLLVDQMVRELEKLVPLVRFEPAGVLYHYTSASGLLGILESSTIRATHYRYLNDPRSCAPERRSRSRYSTSCSRRMGSTALKGSCCTG